MKVVGIVGTGEMGWRMGRRLLAAGHRVLGYDLRDAALNQAAAAGLEICGSLAELARQSDCVISCVTDGAALRAVVAGEQGLAATLRPGCPLIDMTSAEPWITQELAPLLSARGIPFLDAPVSGGVPAAEEGRLNFMVGGDAELLQRCRPLLEVLGPTFAHMGGSGAGHAMKAINMLAMAGSLLATAECLAVGQACGLAPETLLEVFNQSSGGSFVSRVHFPRYIVSGTYRSGFTFDLMHKDLGIARGLAQRLGAQLFVGTQAVRLYEAAAATGLAGQDNTRVVSLIYDPARRRAAEQPRIPSPAATWPKELRKVGFVGLGAMGSRMVGRLLEREVVPLVFDLAPAAREAAAALGARVAENAGAVARASDLVVLSLPDAKAVRAVVEEISLALAGKDTPTLMIDTSSSEASTSRAAASLLRGVNADFVDAPVSRGAPAAARGELSIMTGGDPAALERCRWLLELLGSDIIPVGGVGLGDDAKALNNLLNATNVVIGGEAIVLGIKAGLEPAKVVEVLNAGSGGSEVLAKRYPQYVLTRRFDSRFRMALMLKDASYGSLLARQARVPALLTSTAVEIYAFALQALGEEADNTELYKLLERWNGLAA